MIAISYNIKCIPKCFVDIFLILKPVYNFGRMFGKEIVISKMEYDNQSMLKPVAVYLYFLLNCDTRIFPVSSFSLNSCKHFFCIDVPYFSSSFHNVWTLVIFAIPFCVCGLFPHKKSQGVKFMTKSMNISIMFKKYWNLPA